MAGVYDEQTDLENNSSGVGTPEDKAQEIKNLEDSFAAKDAKYPDNHPSKEPEPASLYNPANAIGAKNAFSRFSVAFNNNRRGFLLGGGILGTVIALVVAGFSIAVPFQLVHIKEVVASELGGIQEQQLSKRRMRILTRAYFFNNGQFDGYKAKGSLFSFAENAKTDRLKADLEAKGYKIEPETKNGKYTGRFTSIIGPDGVKINESDSLWQRRSALSSAIEDLYPSKSGLWRSKQTQKMYRRYGLERGKWWTDNEATRKLASAEERLKKKIRDTLEGKNPSSSVNKVSESGNQTDTPDPANEKATSLAGAAEDAAQAEFEGLTSGADLTPLNGDLASSVVNTNPAKAFGEGVLNVVKITGPIDGACQAVSAANTIATVSRAQKALQTAKYASLILSMADGVKTGQVDSRSLNDLMTAMNKKDPQTGRSFSASGGWQTLSTKKSIKASYANTYDAGGGFSGEIQTALNQFYSVIPGGKAGTKGTCGTLANPFVQIGSGAIGIVTGFFSAGSSIVVKAAAQTAIEVGKQILIGYATQLGIKAATGTIVDGTEKGERMGDAFSSGAGTMMAMNGSARGFKPLTKKQFAVQQQEYLAYVNDRYKDKSIKERMFDSGNPNSVSYKAVAAITTFRAQGIIGTLASLPASFISFGTKPALAEDQSCNQEEIVANQIQTDAFCNPIMGNTDAELDKIDPIENVIWMYENKYVDGEGVPQGDFAAYTTSCFENEKVNVLFTVDNDYVSEFTPQCFDVGATTAKGIGLHERFRAFQLDSGLLDCIKGYAENGYCDEGDGQQATTAPDGSQITPGPNADATTKEILKQCNSNTATGKVKIVCAAVNLDGIPYGSGFGATSNYLTKDPTEIGCNGFTNISIARATNGKYLKNYCSQTYATQGVKEKQFQQIPLESVEPGDIVIRYSSCGCTGVCGGADPQGRFGHVAVVVSYNKSTGEITVAEASSKSRPSGLREPTKAKWSPSNKYGFSFGMRYIGGGL